MKSCDWSVIRQFYFVVVSLSSLRMVRIKVKREKMK